MLMSHSAGDWQVDPDTTGMEQDQQSMVHHTAAAAAEALDKVEEAAADHTQESMTAAAAALSAEAGVSQQATCLWHCQAVFACSLVHQQIHVFLV